MYEENWPKSLQYCYFFCVRNASSPFAKEAIEDW